MSLTGKSESTLDVSVTNDGFWPDVQVADLLTKYRIPAEYQDEVTINDLVMALLRVNSALTAIKTHISETLTIDSLLAYCEANDSKINNEFVLIQHYQHAVFCYTKAKLLQHYVTINRRKIAENEAKESDDTEQYWLDESQSAIAALFTDLLPDESPASTHGTHIVLL